MPTLAMIMVVLVASATGAALGTAGCLFHDLLHRRFAGARTDTWIDPLDDLAPNHTEETTAP